MTRARDVADAGHSTTATTADTISQKTSINLSGTYSTHQLLVADAFVFTGDLTVNDHLILGKLSDDGNDIVLEGSHTLQGTGQLEVGYITSSGIGSVDGMTGTLGSGVTIPAAGITALESGTTFPAGMMLQVVEAAYTIVANRTSTSLGAFNEYSVTCTISNCLSTSKIFISVNVCANGTTDTISMYALYDVTNSQYVSNMGGDGHFGCSIDTNGRGRSLTFQTLYTPPAYSSNSLTIELYAKGSSSGVRINQRGQGDAYGRGTTNIILQEIAG